MTQLKKNDTYTCQITGYTSDGMGVAHIHDRAVFIKDTIAGETWEVKLLKVTTGAVYAKGIRLITPSPARVTPACPVAGKCGGCSLMHMSYEEELKLKLDKVNQALHRIGGSAYNIQEIIPADTALRYRNKGITAVGSVDGPPCAGFYRQRSHDIIPVADCLLQSEIANSINTAVLSWMQRHNIPAYNEETGKGSVRHVFTRTNRKGQVLVTIVSAKGFGTATPALAPALLEMCPDVVGVVLNVNKRKGNSVLSGDFYTLWGEDTIEESLCGYTFTISPQAFFQINPPQAEKLYNRTVEYAAPNGGTVLDLYCGTGTITLCLSAKADQVIGAEIVPEAVENAKVNALRNGVENAEFLCVDAGEAANIFAARGIAPDCIVVDPPRKGMYPEAIENMVKMNPQRIVYVSCDPGTLARDVKLLAEKGYTITHGTAVDMFPRTNHVETVVRLSRKQIHHMKLNPVPFAMIKSGTKTIELRLNDKKRQALQIGDTICFTNTETAETLTASVVNLHHFHSFEELYATLPLLQCGYTCDNIETADASDMEQYYTTEEQANYGVVGIELKLC